MAEDKAKLLRSLTIDRGPSAVPAPAPRRRRWPALVAGLAVIAAVAAVGFFVPGIRALLPGMGIGGSFSPQAAAPAPPAPHPGAAGPPRPRTRAAAGDVA